MNIRYDVIAKDGTGSPVLLAAFDREAEAREFAAKVPEALGDYFSEVIVAIQSAYLGENTAEQALSDLIWDTEVCDYCGEPIRYCSCDDDDFGSYPCGCCTCCGCDCDLDPCPDCGCMDCICEWGEDE